MAGRMVCRMVLVVVAGLGLAQACPQPGAVPPSPTGEPAATDPVGLGPGPLAGSGQLDLGDAAPPLGSLTWLQGDALESFEAGRVAVVAFWVPGWPSSREAGRLLSAVGEALGDDGRVAFIAWGDEGGQVTERAVSEFVAAQGSGLSCPVAFDGSGATHAAYMLAAAIERAPYAFVVDQRGLIAWHGVPLDGQLPAVVQLVVEGTWDVEEYKRIVVLEARAEEILGRALAAWSDGRREDCVSLLQEGFDLDHGRFARFAVWRFHALHAEMGESERAYAFARELVEGPLADSPDALADLAWVAIEAPPERAYDDIAAERAARRALEVSGEQHGHAWGAVAMIEAHRQNFEAALEAWERALSFVPSDELEQVYLQKQRETREAYERAVRDAVGGP